MSEPVVVYTDKHRIPFLVDADDYESVRRYSWSIDSGGYPATCCGKWPKERKTRLHVFLLGRAPDGLEWDHENRDKLNNRRSNLRPVTALINLRNTSPRVTNRSGVKGVYQGPSGTWIAQIMTRGVRKHVGSFATLADAAAARQAAEQELWTA